MYHINIIHIYIYTHTWEITIFTMEHHHLYWETPNDLRVRYPLTGASGLLAGSKEFAPQKGRLGTESFFALGPLSQKIHKVVPHS